jgi:5-methylcytosine-specific restriction protein A
MPTQAPRPCNKSACNGLVRDGVCVNCGPIRRAKDRAHDEHRGTAAQRGYDSTWRKVRRMQLAQSPLCFDCGKDGGVVLATEVHHIKARRLGGENTEDNLMSLCKTHHSKRTAAGE